MQRLLMLVFFFLFNYPASQTPNPYQQAKTLAMAEYTVFKRFEPEQVVPTDELKRKFPSLFSYIPDSIHNAIANYVEFLFNKDLVHGLSIQSPEQLLFLKWTALGLAYNTVPFYSPTSSFFYFEQNSPNTTIVKGKRRDLSIKTVDETFKSLLHYEKELKEKKDAVGQINEKIRKIGTQKEFLDLDFKRQELLNEIESLKNGVLKHIQFLYNDVERALVQEYKIHLMPTGELTPTIIRLLEALSKDAELQQLIAAFKVLAIKEYKKKHETVPRIVIYPTAGKENVQKLLNKLFELFKYMPGLDERPRYNAKVTDLIWIAQGDSVDKDKPQYAHYYELPRKIYYNPLITGRYQDYHLVHPVTGQEIIE